jgi:metallophosphoesterase (TIGR00282 family)
MLQLPYPSSVPPRSIDTLRVAFLGDIVGRPGRAAVKECVPRLKKSLDLDLVIANGENAAGGAGIDGGTAQEIKAAGVELITLGDHAFQRKGVNEFLDAQSTWCIRPLNHPKGTPGAGWCVKEVASGVSLLLVNLIGRVFIGGPQVCPFRAVDEVLNSEIGKGASVVVVDLHAEATSEKWAMARYLDGRASLLVGTHTHVLTADAQILSGGLGMISDLGMCGSNNGVIGMKSEVALKRFLTPLPAPYEVAEGFPLVQGVVADLSLTQRSALWISPLRENQTSEKASQGSGQQ